LGLQPSPSQTNLTITTVKHPNGQAGTTSVNGINDAGHIPGTTFQPRLQSRFLDRNSAFSTVKDPIGSDGAAVNDINSPGEIFGSTGTTEQHRAGFLQ
jgi:hypothetical protein